MRRIAMSVVLIIFPVLAAGVAGTLAAEEKDRNTAKSADGALSLAEFTQLHRQLTKMSTERVWSIPWQLSVREARELAAKENKPVFLWISSNGGTHPLGPC